MMGAHSKAYVSKNFISNYAKKKQKIEQKKLDKLNSVKESKEEDKKSVDSSDEEDDLKNRSICSLKDADLDNDLNYSDEEPDIKKAKAPVKKL